MSLFKLLFILLSCIMSDGQFSECWKGSVSLTLAVCSVVVLVKKKGCFHVAPVCS